jgi:hypothetical protein
LREIIMTASANIKTPVMELALLKSTPGQPDPRAPANQEV